MKHTLLLIAAVPFVACATPAISNVSLSRNEATGLVTISYDLSEDAIVTAQVVTNGVALPHADCGNTSPPDAGMV